MDISKYLTVIITTSPIIFLPSSSENTLYEDAKFIGPITAYSPPALAVCMMR